MKQILELFGKALRTNNPLPFGEVNKIAVKVGYVVPPNLCSVEVLEWLKTKNINVNATFYKSWNDIISKNRFELFVDQILHYASTYGTEFEGLPYIPNEGSATPVLTELKVLEEITLVEAKQRCVRMLISGAALKQETIESLLAVAETEILANYNDIKNREAMMVVCQKLGILPQKSVECLRYLLYLKTGKTLLIKDRQTIENIKNSTVSVTSIIEQFGINKLSEIFLRFKPLFLACKSLENDKAVINRLRRKAERLHKPLAKGYWDNIFERDPDNKLNSELSKLNNFKKVALLQTILVRSNQAGIQAFPVRNGKLFVKEGDYSQKQGQGLLRYSTYYSIIYGSLIAGLAEKKCRVLMPENINIKLPSSEKSFIGNYPLGTSFNLGDKDNIVGIHWRESDGARDIDLSLINLDGNKYGWNSHYRDAENSIVYSGDMTSASPEAVELFYTNRQFKPAIVKANIFNGSDDAKFKLFFAQEKIGRMHRNYMVDPNNILFAVDVTAESKENLLGVFTDSQFVLCKFRTGRGRVSGDSVTNKYTEYMMKNLSAFVDLRSVLNEAGFEFVKEKADLDFSNLSKDTLIDLMS